MIDVRMTNVELFELYEELMRLTQDSMCGNEVLIKMFDKIRNVLLNALNQAYSENVSIFDEKYKNRLMQLAGLADSYSSDNTINQNSENKKELFESWERRQKVLIEQLKNTEDNVGSYVKQKSPFWLKYNYIIYIIRRNLKCPYKHKC